ncbi:MAG: PHP domain-containing protein [Deltaproteobacteria bacterium]|nr:MAG: PHP domain-containing protein [Deltaproteobacteria bacterium]
MIDLHVHSLLSDGELLPVEVARRFEAAGYKVVAITDHVGPSNLEGVIRAVQEVALQINPLGGIKVIPGVEITHVPPALIGPMVKKSRELGARLVVVHGETIVEPVREGTNLAAIEAGADILAHPGLLGVEEARLAAQRGVFLEISSRRGHSLTNGHVARVAREVGARLVLSSDAHSPEDIWPPEKLKEVIMGAGLKEEEFDEIMKGMQELAERCLGSEI